MEDCTFAPQTKWSVQKKIDGRAHQNASNTVTAYQNEPNTATSLENETASENLIGYEINEPAVNVVLDTRSSNICNNKDMMQESEGSALQISDGDISDDDAVSLPRNLRDESESILENIQSALTKMSSD
mmetsp:Transcript_36180/g.36407  ORF Transcript_36180/g.36407 Transcript_36180/m.36407 type:complete len:129 (-) Transcript_36180:279-665(-)